MSFEWCELCQVNSGRLMKGRPCCDARFVSGMPKAVRLSHYGKIDREQGAEALADLKRLVNEAYARRQAWKAKRA